jgi:hypothetical protein
MMLRLSFNIASICVLIAPKDILIASMPIHATIGETTLAQANT